MPTIKRYISTDGTEHADVPTMRAHEIVNDVAHALSVTMDDVRGWLGGGVASPEKRDAFLRTAVRIGRARPDDAKRPRSVKPKAVGEAAASQDGPTNKVPDAGAASGGADADNQAEPQRIAAE